MTDKTYYKWTVEDLKNAIHDFRNEGVGLNKCARIHKIPKPTLKRHLNKGDTSESITIKKGRPTTFSNDFEDLLVSHILNLEQHMFGLTINDVRRLAFEVAEKNDIEHTFNRSKRMAGKCWYYGFLKRNKDKISLRQPEATSLNRAKGFNKQNVYHFFDILENIVDTNKLIASKIFNVDETGFQTVQKKPQKIVAGKGKKQVGGLTSGERGVNTTMVTCASASGQLIPPMIIFKRKRMSEQLKEGAPAGSVVTVSESGYINSELFNRWLQHFISVVKPTKEEKVLLLLDGHTSHTKNLDALLLARDNGIILLQLPGHTTHRLQPLDVSFFKPLSTYYTQAIESWMRTNPGSQVTQYQVSQLLNTAYERAATIGNIVHGFKSTGIWPLNRNVFHDYHFAASESLLVNDTASNLTSSFNIPVQSHRSIQTENHVEIPSTSKTNTQCSMEAIASTSQNTEYTGFDKPCTSQAIQAQHKMEDSISTLSHTIRQSKLSNKRRGAQKAVVLTSSPYKNCLETAQQKRISVITKLDKKKCKLNETEKQNSNKTKELKRKLISAKLPQQFKKRRTVDKNDSDEFDDEQPLVMDDSDSSVDLEAKENTCGNCKRNYYDKRGPKVDWIQCVRCHNWNHETCTRNPDICNVCLM